MSGAPTPAGRPGLQDQARGDHLPQERLTSCRPAALCPLFRHYARLQGVIKPARFLLLLQTNAAAWFRSCRVAPD